MRQLFCDSQQQSNLKNTINQVKNQENSAYVSILGSGMYLGGHFSPNSTQKVPDNMAATILQPYLAKDGDLEDLDNNQGRDDSAE